MGSSTTSETTINTSTESASTLVTNITATDTETNGTLDSLDLGKTKIKFFEPLKKMKKKYLNLKQRNTNFFLFNCESSQENIFIFIPQLGDTSGQSEPLLSSLDEPQSSIISQLDNNSIEKDVDNIIIAGPDTPLLINYEVTSFYVIQFFFLSCCCLLSHGWPLGGYA